MFMPLPGVSDPTGKGSGFGKHVSVSGRTAPAKPGLQKKMEDHRGGPDGRGGFCSSFCEIKGDVLLGN